MRALGTLTADAGVPVTNRWLNNQPGASTAKASVDTPRNKPRIFSAGNPTAAATAAPSTAPTTKLKGSEYPSAASREAV
ncbi:hypothetical protein D3C83_220720 [compost metagenome]